MRKTILTVRPEIWYPCPHCGEVSTTKKGVMKHMYEECFPQFRNLIPKRVKFLKPK